MIFSSHQPWAKTFGRKGPGQPCTDRMQRHNTLVALNMAGTLRRTACRFMDSQEERPNSLTLASKGQLLLSG